MRYDSIEYDARKDLQFLAMCIDAYFKRTGEVPQSIFLATSEFERQVPDHWKNASEAIDPWGHPYKMLKTTRGFQIWSYGRNGIDESGSGDDIVKNLEVN